MTDTSRSISLANLTGTTPFPNYLLDAVMPTLTDTQWRLLCVVVRQTLGWQASHSDHREAGQRKSVDWLTHHQLKARTGRSSAVLCRALDTLERRDLLEVSDSRRQPLVTAESRQRYGSRLYFRLGSAVLAQILRDYPVAPSGAQLSAKSEKGFLETRLQKVRTTKATPTKCLSNDKEAGDAGSQSRLKASVADTSELPNPDVKRFLAAYIRLFKQHNVSGDPPTIDWGKDGKVVKELLKLYPYDRLEQLLVLFFDSRDAWFMRRGYSLPAFKSAINCLLVSEANAAGVTHKTQPYLVQSPVLRTGRWRKAGDRG